MTNRIIRRWWPAFALPTFLAFVFGFIAPFIIGIYLSFTSFTTITDAEWVGVENYILAFQDPVFLHALGLTALFAIVTTIIINVAAFFIAYMLNKAIRGAKLFRSAFFLPNLIGGIVLGYIWQLLLNGVLSQWGLSLVLDVKYGFIGMVIVTCWQSIGYQMIIYIAGLQAIPDELIEAAAVDGATSRQITFRIIVPLMMPTVTVCSFLTLTGGFKMFDANLALTGGAPSDSSAMLALDIYKTFYGRIGFEGVGQAKAVLFLIIVGVVALIQNAATRSREVES
ncbi:sugar ABC transporter permease [Bifidobacterium pullorum subsp. saeculare]|uniref:carbohydrate ABC transporter permease n=1 Tax=Bifidobacterium pullorum TaxID=78448 RepID=UPI00195BC130|nr:sugar ABC transporter permease [Bifidobacterium pullorum]MBM6695782.1 sugar ABC transporter permease [Bifidobacterium pullorum subsp. saeculare]